MECYLDGTDLAVRVVVAVMDDIPAEVVFLYDIEQIVGFFLCPVSV